MSWASSQSETHTVTPNLCLNLLYCKSGGVRNVNFPTRKR